jgi:pyridoxal phosphate enzyme (YggS family)
MDSSVSHVSVRLQQVHARIQAAQARAGRTHPVRVVGVTKYLDAGQMTGLHAAGIHIFGENRVQVALQKQDWFATRPEHDRPSAWHFIGHIQRNKLARLVGRFELIHSVDSLPLLELLARLCGEQGLEQAFLLEVNISGEEAKQGFDPVGLAELPVDLLRLPGLKPLGLMGMAAELGPTVGAAEVRASFQRLAQLRDRLQHRWGLALPELSMGMSGDFEIAVEEGATLVRIGSLLYS